MRSLHPALVFVALVLSGCCPSRSQQTGVPVVLTGAIGPRGIAVHDFSPPPQTTQSDVILSWTSGSLHFSELVPTCPSGQEDHCVRLTDPIGARETTPRELRLIVTNQRPENRNEMKFLLENQADETASYTLTIVPRSAGCT